MDPSGGSLIFRQLSILGLAMACEPWSQMRVCGLGLRGLGFKVKGLGLRVKDLGFRVVEGFGVRPLRIQQSSGMIRGRLVGPTLQLRVYGFRLRAMGG